MNTVKVNTNNKLYRTCYGSGPVNAFKQEYGLFKANGCTTCTNRHKRGTWNEFSVNAEKTERHPRSAVVQKCGA